MAVFVLGKLNQSLMLYSKERAQLLLERVRAVVHQRYPLMIRLKGRVGEDR